MTTDQTLMAQANPMMPASEQWDNINADLKTGANRQQIKQSRAAVSGKSEDDEDLDIVSELANKVNKAREGGASDDQIRQYMIENRYDNEIMESAIKYAGAPKDYKKYSWKPGFEPGEAMDLGDLYKNVHGKYSTTGKTLLGFAGNDAAGLEARREVNQLNASISTYLNKQGFNSFINPNDGEVMLRNEQGVDTYLDESIINDLWNTKGEMVGAITGGIAGAKAGAMGPKRTAPLTVPGGMIAGAAIGAAAGKSFDLMINSYRLKEKIDAELYKDQMIEAGVAGVVMDVAGAGVLKLGSVGLKGINKAYDYAIAGNLNGATKLLRESMHLSEDQAKEITQRFTEQLKEVPTKKNWRGKDVPLNEREMEIAAITSTVQGAEGFVRQAAAENPRLANAMLMNIDKRAKDLNAAIAHISDDNVGNLIRNDLKAYQDDVKNFYGMVKQEGADAIDGTDFRFDLDKLAIAPVLQNVQKKISDPRNQENFIAYATRIENASKDRSFSGLLELRQAVNDFKYSKSGLSKTDYDAVNAVINKIDGQVNKAVKDYMPNAKQWQTNWASAKAEYSKMKQIEDNALFQSINRKSATESQIQKLLNKYGNDLDVDKEVFNSIANRLSPATRAKAEGAAIKNLTNKYTYGKTGESQAVNFVALADELNGLNISTPEGKRLTEAVNEMAKVFKNDDTLSGVSGNMAVPKFASNLSADLRSKVKYALIGEVWNALKTAAPGKKSNAAALAKHTQKVLENPMSFKETEALIKSVPKESQPQMRSLVEELRQQAAAAPAKKQEKIKMYKQTSTGKLSSSNGALGKGVYLVDKVAKPTEGSKVVAQEVNVSKLATMQNISDMIGREVTEKEIRTIPGLQEQLREAGYLGIRTEGRAMLFPEQIVGQNLKKPVETQTIFQPIVKEVASKPDDRIKTIIKELDANKSAESQAALKKEAEELGYNVYKRSAQGTAKNSTGLNGKYTYSKKK